MCDGKIRPALKVFVKNTSCLAQPIPQVLPLGYESCWCAGLSRGGIRGCGCSRWMSSPWALEYLQGEIFPSVPVRAGGIVCGGARLAGTFTYGQHSQEWANVSQAVELLVMVRGSFCPRFVVHSHVRCVEWELPGQALQPREQQSGLGPVPGLFLQSKRCEHPADGGTSSLHLTCLI